MRMIPVFLILLSALTLGQAALAQSSPYAAAISVNDNAVTYFEIEQRRLFLKALRAPGDLNKEAVEGLIDDRLRLQAGKTAGIALSDEGLAQGMSEFAGRANLSTAQFIAALAEDGIAVATFRDFVRAGLIWREVVRARFGPRAGIGEAELDRALSLAGSTSSARILLSEIVIPLRPDQPDEAQALAATLSKTLNSFEAFAAAAREYSVAPTASAGGKLNWLPLSNLPPQIVPLLLTLDPGDVTEPVPIGNAIAVFQMRALDERLVTTPQIISADYAIVLIPGGRSAAALGQATKLRDEIDTCDDLYGVAPDLREVVLRREVLAMGDIPRDIALELAKLDPNEVSLQLTNPTGSHLIFLMLCARTTELAEGARDQLRQALFNQRLTSYADSYLEELRAEAIIVTR